MEKVKPLDELSLTELQAELVDLEEVMTYESDAIWQSIYVQHKRELEGRISKIIIQPFE